MYTLRTQLLVLLVILGSSLYSQVNPFIFENAAETLHDSDLIYFNKCRIKLNNFDFVGSIPDLEKVSEKHPQNKYLSLLLGICYCYDTDNSEKAISEILKLEKDSEKIDNFNYYLGYAYQQNYSALKALYCFETELKKEELKTIKRPDYIKELNLKIAQCKTLNSFKNKQNTVKIKNIGKPINSAGAEYCPLIPSNELFMIYTYRGDKSKSADKIIKEKKLSGSGNSELFFEDIFISFKINDSLWANPQGIDVLNTTAHDAAVSLNFDGTQLFIYKNVGAGHGDLYLSKFVGDSWTKPIYQMGLNTAEWEGSACFLPNDNKIIFASERKGGYGGKDLYIAEKIKDNTWGNIKNLGPLINTKFDEDAPFVTADGRILYFSSNNPNSTGGYDVFRSNLKNNLWQQPFNLGPPINTANDDIYYTVRADGKKGYYSSYKRGGKGEQDIYSVEPGIPGKSVQLLQLDGLVSIDNKPSGAEIEIHSLLNHKRFNITLNANKQNGKFLANLSAGDNYEVIIKPGTMPPQVLEIKTQGIDSFAVLNVYADFVTPEYDQKISYLKPSIANELNKHNELFDKKIFSEKYGNFSKENLYFKVQVGAFKLFENFSYNVAIGLPKIIRQTDNDGITRFTMGNYKTYNEALALLEVIQKSKIKDCFIIAVYNGEKKQLHQLFEEKIIE